MDLAVPGYYDRYLSARPGSPEMRHIGIWNWMMNVPGSESAAGVYYAKHQGSAGPSPNRILSSDNAGSLLENASKSFGASDKSLSSRISFSFQNACATWGEVLVLDAQFGGGMSQYQEITGEIPDPAPEHMEKWRRTTMVDQYHSGYYWRMSEGLGGLWKKDRGE